ncbi:unnamed protein product [Lupinus luteus]|uniref:Uncharacterized protein n=1 Tax=Lupinus luteus TaxID=3873 RepID=A0AAV1VRH4_LUPLU
MTPGSRKPSQSRKGQSWYFCPRSRRLGETKCRLSEGASLGRERSRLGENAQDFELASGGFSLGRECLAWARMPRLGESSHAWARMAQAMPRKESRKPRNELTDRKRLGRGPSRVFSDVVVGDYIP